MHLKGSSCTLSVWKPLYYIRGTYSLSTSRFVYLAMEYIYTYNYIYIYMLFQSGSINQIDNKTVLVNIFSL